MIQKKSLIREIASNEMSMQSTVSYEESLELLHPLENIHSTTGVLTVHVPERIYTLISKRVELENEFTPD